MTVQPTEGRCELCNQLRPLFDLPFTDGSQQETARLCARDYSRASRMAPGQLAEELFFAIGGAR